MAEHEKIYDQLAEKYKLVGDAWFMDLLQLVMTPEEGRYILALSTPLTTAETAKKLGVDAQVAETTLDNMARRGLLFRGKSQYIAWMDSHQLKARIMFSADEYIAPGYLELRRRENRHLSNPFSEVTLWLKMYETTRRPLNRVLPARKAIASNPKILPQQVLWYEDVAQMLRRADKIGVADCDCRRIFNNKCGMPMYNCMHTGKNILDYEVGRGGRIKVISLDEAVAAMDEAEEAGLVHNTPGNFAAFTGLVCNCCGECCSTFEPALECGRINEIVSPSRFRASVKTEECKGCKVCTTRCIFGAIEMVKAEGSVNLKAHVIEDKWMGCGVCVLGCKAKAMTFELVRPPTFIPPRPQMGTPLTFTTQ